MFAGDKGYVSLSVNMPVQPSTKSANDNFADGTAEEYAVKDATLLLFAGTSEATATYYAKYDLDGDEVSTFAPADDQITAQKAYTQEIDVPEASTDNIYALVLLNSGSILNKLNLTENSTTLSDLTSTAVTVSASDLASSENGFFMSNSPLFNKKGGTSDPTGGEVSTLVLIDVNNIYGSAAEAAANPAADIYVEHAVAKVTVEDETNGSTSLATNNSTVASVSILGYTLDLTNNSMYPVRNTSFTTSPWGYYNTSTTSASDKYRFVGGLEVGAELWRTYWGKDPNYDSSPYYTDDTTGERVYKTSADDENYTMSSKYGETPTTDDGLTALKDGDGNDNPTYCLENTFNVEHMNKAETTRAIIAVQITLKNDDDAAASSESSNDFYIINDHKSKVMTEDDVKDYILEVFESYGAVEQAQSLWSPTGDDADADLFENVIVSVTPSETSANATISISFDDAIKADNFTDSQLPDVFSSSTDDYEAAMAYVNSEVAVAYYKGGISYYPVMIEHFGDTSTPWTTSMVAYDENNTDYDADNSTSYPEGVNSGTAENNWLGRWGVLRNNWYEIDVTDVVEIGSPTVPEAQDEPDDPTESWINVEINILSWVKRQQGVGL